MKNVDSDKPTGVSHLFIYPLYILNLSVLHMYINYFKHEFNRDHALKDIYFLIYGYSSEFAD